jgi:hypothetical protein
MTEIVMTEKCEPNLCSEGRIEQEETNNNTICQRKFPLADSDHSLLVLCSHCLLFPTFILAPQDRLPVFEKCLTGAFRARRLEE